MPTRVKGYFSIFGNPDLNDEIVEPGAFSDWIARGSDGNLPAFWTHDYRLGLDPTAMPIGRTDLIVQDEKGAFFKGFLSETPKGNRVARLINDGVVRAASFAYRVDRDTFDDRGFRRLLAVTPLEVTFSTWGINPLAYVEPDPAQKPKGETNDNP